MPYSVLERKAAAGWRTDRKSIDSINVVIAIDHHFARGAAVTVRSLLESTREPERVRVHVLDTGLTEEDRERLHRSWRSDNWKGAKPAEFIDLSAGPLTKLRDIEIASHVTLAGFARLLMTDLFPALNEVWWLDSDLIFQGDIVDLDEYPTYGKPLAAAVNNATPIISASRGVRNWQATDLDPNGPYLQSGVLKMNLQALRAMEFTKMVFEVVDQYKDTIKGGDQEILNRLFGKRLGGEVGWAQLPFEWNDTEVHFADLGRVLEVDRITDNPSRPAHHARGATVLAPHAKIIHVTEIPKPWDAEYWGPVVREIFKKFEERTAWFGDPYLPLGGRDLRQAEYVGQIRSSSRPFGGLVQ